MKRPLKRMLKPAWDHVPAPQVSLGLELGLQPAHLRVLNAISHGLDEAEAAVVLGISYAEAHDLMQDVRRELAAKNAAHAVARGLRFGVIA